MAKKNSYGEVFLCLFLEKNKYKILYFLTIKSNNRKHKISIFLTRISMGFNSNNNKNTFMTSIDISEKVGNRQKKKEMS